MSRGTHTKTSQCGSSRDFAHVNKFSLLASDDDESPGECCTSERTSRMQCQSQRCVDERGDECITAPETKFPSHRISGTSELNAHQVSYLAASGGDSRGVHHVSGSGWRRLSPTMDSGSAECVAPQDIAKSIPLMETEASRQGQTYHTADGGVIKNKGDKTVMMYSETGDQYRARHQITDVTRPLNSFSRVCDQGNNVLFTQTGGWIINHETGRYTWFPQEHRVYVVHSWIKDSQPKNVCNGQMSLFPGRSARFLRFRVTRGSSCLCQTSLEEA